MKFVTSTSQDSLFIELEPFVPGGISTLVKVGDLTTANELGEFYFSAVEGMKYSSTQLRAIADWLACIRRVPAIADWPECE